MSAPPSETPAGASSSEARAELSARVVAAVVVFAVCLLFTGPGAYWLDSAELTAAAFELGVPHPPGHPVYALTTKAFMMLPVGSVPFRASLASGAALAAAAALFVGVALLLARSVLGARGRAVAWLACGCVVAACLSYGAAFQGVRAEVYALHLALVAAVLRLVVAMVLGAGGVDLRGFFLAALLWGLALANHHWLAILGVTPLAALALWRCGRRGLARVGACAAAVALGLGAYAYLPTRAEHAPVVSWGDPVKAERFAWVVSARAFQKALKPRADTSLADNVLTLAGVTMEAVTPVGLVVGLLGLGFIAWRRRALGVGLLGASTLTFLSQLTMPADPLNPDVHGYLMLGMLLFAVGTFVALVVLMEWLRRPRLSAWLCGVLSIGLPVGQLLAQAPRFSLRTFDAAEAVSRGELRTLPAGSALFSSYFQSAFLWWHARVVEGERPDVALVDRHFARYPGYAARERVRVPELAPAVDALLEKDFAALRALAERRPIFFELDLDLPSALANASLAAPLWSRLAAPRAQSSEGGVRAARARRWARARAAVGDDAGEPETRRYFLWKHFVAATVAMAQGARGLAEAEVRRGLVLAPDSKERRALLASARGK